MTSDVLSAVERLTPSAAEQGLEQDDCIDDTWNAQGSRKRVERDPEVLKRKLEDNFLCAP